MLTNIDSAYLVIIGSSSSTMAGLFPVLFMFVVTAGLVTFSALFTPKGPNQVYVHLLSRPASDSLAQDHSNSSHADLHFVLFALDDHLHGAIASFARWLFLYMSLHCQLTRP